MLHLLPRMALEAPDDFVAFVERHLPRLRRDAALVVGDGRHADELYPDVLADVAARWALIELVRRYLRRPDAAEDYLRRAFARRAKRWQDEQITPVEVEIWQVERLDEPLAPAMPQRPAPQRGRAVFPQHADPMWTSMALRLAPVLLVSARLEVRPLAEAAVAWWHAYEAARRRRYVAAAMAFFLVLALIMQVPMRDSELFAAPASPDVPACRTVHPGC